MSDVAKKHPHYHKDVRHLETIDVYRVLQLFNVTDPCLQHAIKKLLVAGGRGAGKDISRDVQEAIDSLKRMQEMCFEDEHVGTATTVSVPADPGMVTSVYNPSSNTTFRLGESVRLAMAPDSAGEIMMLHETADTQGYPFWVAVVKHPSGCMPSVWRVEKLEHRK